MEKKVEDHWEHFPGIQVVISESLLGDSDLSFFLEVFTLDWNGKVIPISFFDLNNHADGHGFLCEGHPDNFVQHWATESNLFNGTDTVQGTDLDESEFFNVIVSD